jgi:hypothetical protein
VDNVGSRVNREIEAAFLEKGESKDVDPNILV